jgi:hypothetical protein
VILLAVRQPTPALLAAEAGCCLAALGLLRALARDRGPRRDENLISTIAIVGRAMIVMLLAHLSMTVAHWPALRADLVISALCLLTAGPAASMLRHGPVRRALPASTWARLKRETPGPRPTVTL